MAVVDPVFAHWQQRPLGRLSPASLPVAATTSEVPPAISGTASLTLSASGDARAPVGAGSGYGQGFYGDGGYGGSPASGGVLTLSASGGAAGAASAAGSLSLTGTGTAAALVTGSGSLTLSGAGTPGATASATGSLTLSASGAGRATASGTGSLTLTGTHNPVVLVDTRSGTATSTSATITLPTYLTTDYIVLFVSSNNANAQTFGANVTATSLTSAGDRLNAWRIVPQDGAQTTFTLGVGVSSVLTWWIATYRGVDAAVAAASTNIGNSTTATIESVGATASWVASGSETVLSAGSVNSTATWTPTASTLFNTTSGNAALMVNGDRWTTGALTALPTNIDRGLGGTSRNESTATVVLRPSAVPVQANRLLNPSFEDAAGTSVSWETEETVAGVPAFTKVSSGAIDGIRVQQMQYAGQAGDSAGTGIFAIYQSPITASPGEQLTFRISLSGTKANCTMIVGIEGFAPGQVYISEADTVVTTLTGTMTEYSVTYTVPSGANAVAAYVQVNEVVPTTSLTAQLDKAILTAAPTLPATGTGSLTLTGSATPAAPSSASGSLSLTGSGAPAVPVVGTASIGLSAAGSPTAPATSLGSLTLVASTTLAVRADAQALLTLSASGSAHGGPLRDITATATLHRGWRATLIRRSRSATLTRAWKAYL